MAGVATDLFKLLCQIADQPSAKITAENLKGLHSAAEKLITSGALLEAPYSQDIQVTVDDEERSYAVQQHNGGMAYFSPRAGWVAVKSEDLLVYKVNFDSFLRVIMDALGIPANTQPQAFLDEKLWFIGSAWLNKRKTPVIFARTVTKQDVGESLRRYLQDRHISDPALILTSSSNIPAYFQLPGQNRIVLLADAIDTETTNLALKMPYLVTKMGGCVDQNGFSQGYRVLHHRNGQNYTFSKMKASVLEVMDKAGKPMHQDEIMAQSESSQNRLIDLFRNDPAWKTIFETDGSGNYWLNY